LLDSLRGFCLLCSPAPRAGPHAKDWPPRPISSLPRIQWC